MKEELERIFNDDCLLKEKDSIKKQELIIELLKKIKEEELNSGNR